MVAACSRPLSHCTAWSLRFMLRCAATSCYLGDSPGAVPNCVSWRLADNRSLPCDDPPSLSRNGSKRVPKRSVVRWRAQCRALRASKVLEGVPAPRSGCFPCVELLCDVGEQQDTTGTFLVLLVYGPRSIGVIRSTKWVFREKAVAASPPEGAKLSRPSHFVLVRQGRQAQFAQLHPHQCTRHRD